MLSKNSLFSKMSSASCFVLALLLGGCGSGGSTGSGGSGNPSLTVSAGSLTFTTTALNTQSAAQTITFTNSGSGALVLASITVTGTNPTAFAMPANTCGVSLNAGSSCSVSVTFTAAAVQSYSATVTATDNSGGVSGTTQTVTLSGSVVVPVASLSTTAITFSPINVGTTSAAQTITLTNTGLGSMTVTGAVLGGTNPSVFTMTNGSTSCQGATLAANASCSVSLTFTPAAATSYSATVTFTDNATGSPQAVAVSGSAIAPISTLSSTLLSFPTTAVNVTSAPLSFTITNSGSATLNLTSIVLGGTNASNFAISSNTCGASLAVGTPACTVSVTFTPNTATSYSAKITVTTNASSSPQTVTLAGSSTSSSVTYALYTFPETDASVTPLYALVNGAAKTIDMTMYALEDTVFTADLVADCKRGVVVRVILDQNDEKSGNTTAYNALNAQAGCSAVWANKAFEATHEKSFIVDGTQVAIMSLNLQSTYYSTTRDFAMVENDPVDISAIQLTFNNDYAAGTPSSGVAGTSDFSYIPGTGTDLIWSPTTAQAAMINIIANAKSTLLIENEEMSTSVDTSQVPLVQALVAACQAGVVVHIAMVDQSSYEGNFTTLENAGCHVRTVPDTSNGFYIHAKAVVADYGLSTQSVYMGSINYSSASMNNNRELGMYIRDPASIVSLYTVMNGDFNSSLTTEW